MLVGGLIYLSCWPVAESSGTLSASWAYPILSTILFHMLSKPPNLMMVWPGKEGEGARLQFLVCVGKKKCLKPKRNPFFPVSIPLYI